MGAMSIAYRRMYWFLGLYWASIVALAIVAFMIRGLLRLAR
jgi:hypothetical protein